MQNANKNQQSPEAQPPAKKKSDANFNRYLRLKENLRGEVFEGIRRKESNAQFLDRLKSVMARADFKKLKVAHYKASLHDHFRGMLDVITNNLTGWYHCLDGVITDPYSAEGRERIKSISDYYERLEKEGSSDRRWIADTSKIFF